MHPIEIDLWQIITLAGTLLGAWFAGVKLFFAQIDRNLSARFTQQEEDRRSQDEALRALFENHANDERKRFDRLDIDVRAHAERMARLEQDVERMPSHADLSKLYDKLNTLASGVAALSGKIDGIEGNLRLVVSRFIEKGIK